MIQMVPIVLLRSLAHRMNRRLRDKRFVVVETTSEAEVISDSADAEEASGPAAGRGGAGFGGGPGGPGGRNFQAIQEALENDPEIAELIERAQSGNLTQADQERLQELMQEALAEAGIEIPQGSGGGQGLAGAPPANGTIASIDGSTITFASIDDSDTTTEVQVSNETTFTIVNQLEVSDLSEGDEVFGTVRRGEGGAILIITLSIIPEDQGGGFGIGRAFAGPGGGGGGGFGGGDGGPTDVSAIRGSIAAIEDDMVHVETTQGTLRLTANEDTLITSTSDGTLSDLSEGMIAIAIGPQEDGVTQARNITAGPESLLRGDAPAGFRGTNRRGQGQQTP